MSVHLSDRPSGIQQLDGSEDTAGYLDTHWTGLFPVILFSEDSVDRHLCSQDKAEKVKM
jgi:hypothetical protein